MSPSRVLVGVFMVLGLGSFGRGRECWYLEGFGKGSNTELLWNGETDGII